MACQKAPSAKRCIKTGCDGSRIRECWFVRKHRAPKGALRRNADDLLCENVEPVRKHRAPKGALRHGEDCRHKLELQHVRKHRAPKGALRLQDIPPPRLVFTRSQKAPSAKRCIKTWFSLWDGYFLKVRRHRAPKGALRRERFRYRWGWVGCQKAPSAKRSIKTLRFTQSKASLMSESTERQTVH